MDNKSRKTLVRELGRICREIIHIRDQNACRRCGIFVGEKGGNCHHIIPKKRGLHVRWVLNNLVLLCPKCHFWYHSDPFAIEWFKKNDPNAYDVVLELNRKQTQSFKQQDLLEWVKMLETILIEVQNVRTTRTSEHRDMPGLW